MLWAWNMFLAAAPYFAQRFESNEWTKSHYQSSILSVSTITNLAALFVLASRQKNASYPRRIIVSLLLTIVVFALLALASITLRAVSAGVYFAFLMVMVFGASLATGINQNGVFAFVAGFGREEYTQAIMGGQGVAGVLPCVVQIVSVVAVSGDGDGDADNEGRESAESAFIYFLTAVGVAVLALFAFVYLLRHRRGPHPEDAIYSSIPPVDSDSGINEDTPMSDTTNDINIHTHTPKPTSLLTLSYKLRWLASSVFLCFAITMVFPVFTADIESINPAHLSPKIFIPLAFLIWNLGDLLGRNIVLVPYLSGLARYPRTLFLLAFARVGFIPLYLLCNIRGRGAVVYSDFFYLGVVQLLFGVSNGYIGSICMMGAGSWVEEDEREASGAFMSLMLVGGLAVGSLLSFLVASA